MSTNHQMNFGKIVPLMLLILGAGLGAGWLCGRSTQETTPELEQPAYITHWSKLKVGMTKEDVLSLVGAPTSTCGCAVKTGKVKVYPPNATRLLEQQEFAANVDRKLSFTIWSYYGPLEIKTTPKDSLQTALDRVGDWGNEAMNLRAGADGPLHGHALRFDSDGRVQSISSESLPSTAK